MNNSPNTTPSVTEEMMSAGARAMDGWSGPHHARRDLARKIYLAMQSSAPQHTGLTDVERVARAAMRFFRPHLENDVAFSTLCEAIAAAMPQQPVCADVRRLLREARSYVEQAGLRHHDVSGLLAEIDAALDTPTINEGEGQTVPYSDDHLGVER